MLVAVAFFTLFCDRVSKDLCVDWDVLCLVKQSSLDGHPHLILQRVMELLFGEVFQPRS